MINKIIKNSDGKILINSSGLPYFVNMPVLGTKVVDKDGNYIASDDGIDGYSEVNVSTNYLRPLCWLPEPVFNQDIDEMYLLLAVYDQADTYNNCKLNFTHTGTCYVDWGDGSPTEIITSGTAFTHIYKYSDIPESAYCSERGYKMVWCRIFGNASTNITGFNLDVMNDTANRVNLLEIYGNITSYANSLIKNGAVVTEHAFLEILKLNAKDNSVTSGFVTLQNAIKLSYVSITGARFKFFSYQFSNCYNLKYVYFDVILNYYDRPMFDYTFSNCYSLKEVILNITPQSGTVSMDDTNMFYNVFSMQKLIGLLSTGATSLQYTKIYGLKYLTLPSTSYSFSIGNCLLEREALNTLFESLPIVTGKTVTITGNPGALTCDRTIATAKGWTVVG